MKRLPAQLTPDTPLAAAVLPHDAYWMIEPNAGRRLWQMLQSETFGVHMATVEAASRQQSSDSGDKPYEMQGGNAVLYLSGPMTKAPTSFSMGTSTVRMRRLVRQATADPDVKQIVIRIDSPGGAVSGTGDLAADIRAAASVKPVIAMIEDCCCSAAMWIASQCCAVYANPTALVGSVGTLMIVDDQSRRYQNAGVEVLVFGSGKYKGAGTDGAPVTPEDRAYFQSIVDDLNAHFLVALKNGRNLSDEQIAELTDARVHVGQAACDMGLIDGIRSYDDVLSGPLAKARPATTARSRASAQTGEEIGMPKTLREAWTSFVAGFSAGAGSDEEGGGEAVLNPPLFSSMGTFTPPPAVKAFDITQSPEYLALKAQNDQQAATLLTMNTQLAEMNTRMLVQTAEAQCVANSERVEKLVRTFKMTPAEAVSWKQLAKDNPAAFEAAFATQEARPALPQIKGDVVKAKMANSGDPGAQLAELTKAYAKANKVGMAEAAAIVARENPDLAQAHLQSAPVLATEGTN